MSPDDTTDWTIEDLHHLRDDDPGGEFVLIPGGQAEWDRRHIQQLQAADTAVDHLAADPGKPDNVLVRDALLDLGYTQAAHEHMEATRHEDERSFFAALCREYDTRVIEPTAVHTPGKRRKPTPPRGEGGRFLPKGGAA